MIPSDRALVSLYRLSVVAMVWSQFAMHVFVESTGSYCYVISYVEICVTFLSLRVQTTKCLSHFNWTIMDAGCECVPGSMDGYPTDSWASFFVFLLLFISSMSQHFVAQQFTD